MILKKVNIEIPALEKVAKVAEVTFVAKDKSYVLVNLYESAERINTEIVDLDGTVYETKVGNFRPNNQLAKNRTFDKQETISVIGLTLADYHVFYPPQPTPEDILAAKIKALRAEGATCLARIEEIKAELKELEG